ncbi:patatin-like phospholipase family protein [Thaumasiovibrio sp. DFM-14]|uniref:patatin-like phospholipase family protein n=1 Tax=Thaumasiovibrio sp. DFM-14 TaxID=3384792 RepID=UPI0039A2DDBA
MTVFSEPCPNLALVAQGGGQKGVFTSGVLDAFQHARFDPFGLYIGVSAGALNVASFVSRQPQFGFRFISELTTQDRFFNLFKFIRQQQSMDLDWLLKEATSGGAIDLDFSTAQKTLSEGRHALAGVTHKSSLQDFYFPIFGHDWFTLAKATCAIPMLFREPVEMQGLYWVDGGVSSAIPVKEAIRQGAKQIVIIRTEPIKEETMSSLANIEAGIEAWRKSVEAELPMYLARLNLGAELDMLKSFHAQLAEKLQILKKEWLESTVISNLSDEVSKKVGELKFTQGGGRWLFSGDHFYRLQALKGRDFSPQMLDMLMSHYRNTEETAQLLSSLPSGIDVIQIAPQKELLSSALLSKQEELEADYQHGYEVGEQFLNDWQNKRAMKIAL